MPPDPGTVTKELTRIERVANMMTTMHAAMRDLYGTQALILDIVIIAGSLAVCVLSLASSDVLSLLHLSGATGTTTLGAISAVVFFVALVSNRVDWKGRAAAHARALEVYNDFKHRCRRELSTAASDDLTQSLATIAEWPDLLSGCIPIPDARFNPLKSRHLRKVALSKALSAHPHASIWLMATKMRWCDTLAALKGSSPVSDQDTLGGG
jgi:hypothetical protein